MFKQMVESALNHFQSKVQFVTAQVSITPINAIQYVKAEVIKT